MWEGDGKAACAVGGVGIAVCVGVAANGAPVPRPPSSIVPSSATGPAGASGAGSGSACTAIATSTRDMMAAPSSGDQGAATCRSAARSATSGAVGRAAWSLSRHARTSSARCGSTSSTRSSTSGLGSSNATRCSTSTVVPSPNGPEPVTAKARTEPRAKRSEEVATVWPRTCSGDM